MGRIVRANSIEWCSCESLSEGREACWIKPYKMGREVCMHEHEGKPLGMSHEAH